MIENNTFKKEKTLLAHQTAAEVILIQHFGYLVEGAHLYNDKNEELVQGSRAEDDQTDFFIRNEKNPKSVSRGEVFVRIGSKTPKSYVYSQAFERKCEQLLCSADKSTPSAKDKDKAEDLQYQSLLSIALAPLIAEKLYLKEIQFEDSLEVNFYYQNRQDKVEQCLEKLHKTCHWEEDKIHRHLNDALQQTLDILKNQWVKIEDMVAALLKEGMI